VIEEDMDACETALTGVLAARRGALAGDNGRPLVVVGPRSPRERPTKRITAPASQTFSGKYIFWLLGLGEGGNEKE